MTTKGAKWVVYEFRENRPVILSKPQSKDAAEKLRDKLNKSGQYGRRSLGIAVLPN